MTGLPDHGTRARRLRGCVCAPCRAAAALYCKQWRCRTATDPNAGGVPAGPVLAHVERLRATMSITGIAAAAGVPRSTIRRLGEQRKVRHATANALLAVRPATTHAGHYVSAVGTRRRLQALAVLGWPIAVQGRAVGLTRQPAMRIATGEQDVVRSWTAAGIARMYDERSMTFPPQANRGERAHVTRTRKWAAAQRWVPPLAWDDDAIDDPTARPARRVNDQHIVDGQVVDEVLTGHRTDTTSADRDVVVPVLRARGLTNEQIADLCNVSRRTIERIATTIEETAA